MSAVIYKCCFLCVFLASVFKSSCSFLPLTSSDEAHYCNNSLSNQPHRPTPPIPGLSWFPSPLGSNQLSWEEGTAHVTCLAAISHSTEVNKQAPHSPKYLSSVIPNFNISSLVPFSFSGGDGTFFLLGLRCRSTDWLIKGSQLGSGLGTSLPLLFTFALLLWPWVPLAFVCLAFHIIIPIYASPSLSCLHHLVCSSHNCLSYLACRASGPKVPLASTESFRPKTYICILTFSYSSLSTIEGSAHSGYSGFLFMSATLSCPSLPAGQS